MGKFLFKDHRTEKEIEDGIVEYLQRRAIMCSKTDVAMRRDKNGKFRYSSGKKGWFDVTAILPDGRFWGIEVKKHPNKPSPEQLRVHEEARKRGSLVTLAYSTKDVHDDLEEYLARQIKLGEIG